MQICRGGADKVNQETQILICCKQEKIREDVKYYFADFVRNPLFAENVVRKGG